MMFKLSPLLVLALASVAVDARGGVHNVRHQQGQSPASRILQKGADKLAKDETYAPTVSPVVDSPPAMAPVTVRADCVEQTKADFVPSAQSTVIRYEYELLVGLESSDSDIMTSLLVAADFVDVAVQDYLINELVLLGACQQQADQGATRRFLQESLAVTGVTTGETDVILDSDCTTLQGSIADDSTQCFQVEGSFRAFVKNGAVMDSVGIKEASLGFLSAAFDQEFLGSEFLAGAYFVGQATDPIQVLVDAVPQAVIPFDPSLSGNEDLANQGDAETNNGSQTNNTNKSNDAPADDKNGISATAITFIVIGAVLALVGAVFFGRLYYRRTRLFGRGVDKNFDDDSFEGLPVQIKTNETLDSASSSANEPGTEAFLEDLEELRTFECTPPKGSRSMSVELDCDDSILNLSAVAMQSNKARKTAVSNTVRL